MDTCSIASASQCFLNDSIAPFPYLELDQHGIAAKNLFEDEAALDEIFGDNFLLEDEPHLRPSGVDTALLKAVAPRLHWDQLKNMLNDVDTACLNDDSLSNKSMQSFATVAQQICALEQDGDSLLSSTVSDAAAMVQRVFERLNHIKESALHEVLFGKQNVSSLERNCLLHGQTSAKASSGAANAKTAAAAKAAIGAAAVAATGAASTHSSSSVFALRDLEVANSFNEEELPSNAIAAYASDSSSKALMLAMAFDASSNSMKHSASKHLLDANATFSRAEVKKISDKAHTLTSEYAYALSAAGKGNGAEARRNYQEAMMRVFSDAGYRFMSSNLISELYSSLCALDDAHARIHRYLDFDVVTHSVIDKMPVDLEASANIYKYMRLLGLYRLCFEYSHDNEWASIMQDSFPLFRDYAAKQLFNNGATKDIPKFIAQRQREHDELRSKENRRYFMSPEMLENDASLLYECRMHHVSEERTLKFECFLALIVYLNERTRFKRQESILAMPLLQSLEQHS